MIEFRPSSNNSRHRNKRVKKYKAVRQRMMNFEGTHLPTAKIYTNLRMRGNKGRSPRALWNTEKQFYSWMVGKSFQEAERKWIQVTNRYWKIYRDREYFQNLLIFSDGLWKKGKRSNRGYDISWIGLYIDENDVIQINESVAIVSFPDRTRKTPKKILKYNRESFVIPDTFFNSEYREHWYMFYVGTAYAAYLNDILTEEPVPIYLIQDYKYDGFNLHGNQRGQKIITPYLDDWIRVTVPGRNDGRIRRGRSTLYFITKKEYIMKVLEINVARREDGIFQYGLDLGGGNAIVNSCAGRTEGEVRVSVQKDLRFHYQATGIPQWLERGEYTLKFNYNE